MKNLFTLFIATLFISGIYAQGSKAVSAEESDPEAKAILDQLRKRFDSYKTLEAEFTLEIEIPEQPMEKQKGKIIRQDNKYKLDIASQTVISDGKAIYLILHYNKEVQINDLPDSEEDQSLLSPESLLNFYDNAEFIYVLTAEFMEGSRPVQQIEFKPVDRSADYSKIRLTVDKQTKDVVRVQAFAKDGSRYAFKMDKLAPNKTYPAGTFTFDKSKYPDYYVEDLRF